MLIKYMVVTLLKFTRVTLPTFILVIIFRHMLRRNTLVTTYQIIKVTSLPRLKVSMLETSYKTTLAISLQFILVISYKGLQANMKETM